MEWSEVVNHPDLQNLPFKIEQTRFGKLLMNPPASFGHSLSQGGLTYQIKKHHPNGQVLTECPIQTTQGVKVADVAWASNEFLASIEGNPSALPRAPELCVEIVSPSNSREEMRIKTDLYLEAGAEEVWVLYMKSHMDIFRQEGQVETSAFSQGIREQIL